MHRTRARDLIDIGTAEYSVQQPFFCLIDLSVVAVFFFPLSSHPSWRRYMYSVYFNVYIYERTICPKLQIPSRVVVQGPLEVSRSALVLAPYTPCYIERRNVGTRGQARAFVIYELLETLSNGWFS